MKNLIMSLAKSKKFWGAVTATVVAATVTAVVVKNKEAIQAELED